VLTILISSDLASTTKYDAGGRATGAYTRTRERGTHSRFCLVRIFKPRER